MIRFRCHKCTKKIAIKDGAAGMVLKCPSCNALNEAPNPYDPDNDFEIRMEEVRIAKLERLQMHKAQGRVQGGNYESVKRKLNEMDFGLPVDEDELKQRRAERKKLKEDRVQRRKEHEDEYDVDDDDLEYDEYAYQQPTGVTDNIAEIDESLYGNEEAIDLGVDEEDDDDPLAGLQDALG